MKRREFLTGAGMTFAAASQGHATPDRRPTEPAHAPRHRAKSVAKKPMKMHVGCQCGPTTPSMLQFFKRHGVEHICGYPADPGPRGYWTADELAKTREL